MSGRRVLIATVLALMAGLAYASPCTDRRLTCAAAFSSAVNACGGDAKCVEQAQHTYIQCLAVDECGY